MRFGTMGVVALLMGVAGTAHAEATSGKLTQATGTVRVQPPGGSDAAGKVGTVLSAGTRVRTGADGKAEITFDDGTTLLVQAGSDMQLSAAKRQVKKNSVVLFFGRLWSKVTHTSGAEPSYEIKTPNAVCGVRGTEFETRVADDGSARVNVTAGRVAVGGDNSESQVGPGQQADADDAGVGATAPAASAEQTAAWERRQAERLNGQSDTLVEKIKRKIMSRKEKLEALRAEQQKLETSRKAAEERAKGGDEAAADEIRSLNSQLAQIADTVADLGDEATSQFGLVDHYADLAKDARFKGINRKTLEAEAASLRRVKAMLDKMVAEGTDISMEGMDQMMRDIKKGKGSLKEKRGSSVKDMFDGDEMK
jgi:hypothetical protein